MGFLSVLSIVIGSQLGSGIFVLPTSLAPYGWYGLLSWWVAGLGAILLALVFADLSTKVTKTGGPHVFIEAAFGKTAAFYAGWTYWIVSWISSSVVVIASIGYLTPIIGNQSAIMHAILEIALLVSVTYINCKSVQMAGRLEIILTVIKYFSLFIIPIFTLSYFDASNIKVTTEETSTLKIIGNVVMMAFWGFVGVESATAPAEAIANPQKTIPMAIVIGTSCVALLYFIDCLAIMGIVNGAVLAKTGAAHSLAIEKIWGPESARIMAALASLICAGTLNAWTITSGQIALGLSKDGLLPAFFGKRNTAGSPYVNIIISCLGVIPLLILTKNKSIARQITDIIDISVNAFLFIYLFCSASFLKLLKPRQYIKKAVGVLAICFCLCVIYESGLSTNVMAVLFPLSGVFVRLFYTPPDNPRKI